MSQWPSQLHQKKHVNKLGVYNRWTGLLDWTTGLWHMRNYRSVAVYISNLSTLEVHNHPAYL